MTRNGIVVQVREGPFFINSNAGEQRFKGVETGMAWKALSRLSAFLNASLYRARFGTFIIQSAGGDTVLTGNRVPISPDLIVNGGVTFTPVRPVAVTLTVKRVGDVQMDQLNTFILSPYTLVDAAVSWERGPLRVTLSAHNLLNEAYYWGGDTSLAETADPGHPRQVLVTTSLRFK
jgi:outer membrane receptor protein involved in Fe transport